MVVGETGSELDVEAMPAKKSKKGGGVGSFEAKFKKAGTKPVQVWEGKYASLLKSNGWGGNGGRKWPKNWHERELATSELDRMLGRQVLVQLTAKKAEAGPAGESAWGADAGSRQMLEKEEEEDEEEEEEEEEVRGEEEKNPGEEGGEEGGQGDKEGEGSEEAVEGEEGEVLEGGEGADDDEYEKAPPSPSAEDHDDGDSSLADIVYLIN